MVADDFSFPPKKLLDIMELEQAGFLVLTIKLKRNGWVGGWVDEWVGWCTTVIG